jgi:hypothetical protein
MWIEISAIVIAVTLSVEVAAVLLQQSRLP